MMYFGNLTDQQIYWLLGILSGLTIFLLILVISWFAGADPVRKLFHRYAPLSIMVKTIAIVGTVLLAWSDYKAVFTFFETAINLYADAPKVLSITFAAFLEGFAFILGIFLSKAVDFTCDRPSERFANWFGVGISFAGLCAAWVLSVVQRVNLIGPEILEDFDEGTKLTFALFMEYGQPEQIFMMCSPVLTSILAFGLSWLAFPSYSLDKQGRDVEYQLDRYLRFSKRYKKMLMAYQQKKSRLWTALCGADEGTIFDMPADANIYQSRCQQMIRQKTVNACVSAFSGEFGQYNKRIEAELSKYILELSERSTLPHQICEIGRAHV